MTDMILKYAQSPDCILAVTPDRGGAWWSPLRPGEGNPWPSDNPDPTPGLSEAERVRLLTKTNVRTDRGVFEAASDATTESKISTQLTQSPVTLLVFHRNGAVASDATMPGGVFILPSGAQIRALLGFNRVLSESEIAAMIPRREWVFEVEAGPISIVTGGFQNLQWILPDGSVSTATSLTGNVTAGTVICRYSGMDSYSRLDISASSSKPAMLNTVLNINNLPPVTADLRINGIAGLTGNAAALPRVSTYFYLTNINDFYADAADLPKPSGNLLLQNCPNITGSFADLAQNLSSFYCAGTGLTGTTANIPRATTVLNLNNIPGLTGDAADLPLNSGGRTVMECPGITGALPVVTTNTTVVYYRNNSVAPEEYDQTVQNVVDAGAINGTLGISKNRTSASDANIQLLRDRGWTVVES